MFCDTHALLHPGFMYLFWTLTVTVSSRQCFSALCALRRQRSTCVLVCYTCRGGRVLHFCSTFVGWLWILHGRLLLFFFFFLPLFSSLPCKSCLQLCFCWLHSWGSVGGRRLSALSLTTLLIFVKWLRILSWAIWFHDHSSFISCVVKPQQRFFFRFYSLDVVSCTPVDFQLLTNDEMCKLQCSFGARSVLE